MNRREFLAAAVASAAADFAGASALASAAGGAGFASSPKLRDSFNSPAPNTTALKTNQCPKDFVLLFIIFISIRRTAHVAAAFMSYLKLSRFLVPRPSTREQSPSC